MNRYKQVWFGFVSVLSASLLFSGVANAQTVDGELTGKSYSQRVEKFLDDAAESGFRGTVYIRQNGEDLLAKGYGFADEAGGIKNGIDVVYDFGSLTKQFTATAILKLAEQGKVNLDDRLDKYFADVPSDKAAITLHQLLSHSSGLDPYTGDDYKWIEPDAFTASVFKRGLAHSPGETYDYANLGYSLLGMVIEKVTGEEYEAFINQALFSPLKLQSTGYLLPNWQGLKVAQGYRVGDSDPWGTALTRWQGEPGVSWNLKANGGMLSTPREMMHWITALDLGQVISPEFVATMGQKHIAIKEGIGYGYGWRQREIDGQTKLIYHGGSNNIFLSVILRFQDPDGTTLVFVSNQQHKGVIGIIRQLMQMGLDPQHQPEPYQTPSFWERF